MDIYYLFEHIIDPTCVFSLLNMPHQTMRGASPTEIIVTSQHGTVVESIGYSVEGMVLSAH